MKPWYRFSPCDLAKLIMSLHKNEANSNYNMAHINQLNQSLQFCHCQGDEGYPGEVGEEGSKGFTVS